MARDGWKLQNLNSLCSPVLGVWSCTYKSFWLRNWWTKDNKSCASHGQCSLLSLRTFCQPGWKGAPSADVYVLLAAQSPCQGLQLLALEAIHFLAVYSRWAWGNVWGHIMHDPLTRLIYWTDTIQTGLPIEYHLHLLFAYHKHEILNFVTHVPFCQ